MNRYRTRNGFLPWALVPYPATSGIPTMWCSGVLPLSRLPCMSRGVLPFLMLSVPGRTPRDIHVHRDQGINPLHHMVGIPDVAGYGTRAHGKNPFRVRYLFIQTDYPGSHLHGAPPRYNHSVRLTG